MQLASGPGLTRRRTNPHLQRPAPAADVRMEGDTPVKGNRTGAQVADGVHRLTGGVCNFYLIEDGGKLLLVDAGAPADWKLLLPGLASLRRTLADLDAAVITHAHSDHTGFADRARTQAEARVWIHEADAEVARSGQVPHPHGSMARYLLRAEMYRTMHSLGRRGAKRFRTVPVAEVPTFADGDTIDVPGRPRAVHAPGHTPGNAALFLEARGGAPDRRCAGHAQQPHRPHRAADHARTIQPGLAAGAAIAGRAAHRGTDPPSRSRRSVDAGCGRGDPHRQAHWDLVTGKSPRRRLRSRDYREQVC